jgi:hypothetical protein
MNIDYDGVVHAVGDDGLPLCGNAMMPAVGPDRTDDAVNCWECASILD